MIRPEIVTVRMSKGLDVSLSGGARIRVDVTKDERLFAGFAEPDSPGARMAEAVAGNPLLLKILFLRSELARAPGTGRMATSFSFFLDAGCAGRERFSRGDYEAQDRKLGARIGLTSSRLAQSYDALAVERMGGAPGAGRQEAPAARGPADPAGAYGGALGALAGRLGRGGAPAERLESMMMASYELDSWDRLRAAVRRIPAAQKNTASLADEICGRGGAGQITTALSKLAGLAGISTESVCLDCWYERDWMPFMSGAANTRRPSLHAACPSCGGAGLLHTVVLEAPDSVKPLMLAGRSWFPEIAVGYAVSQVGAVDRVFVHKRIQPHGGGGVRKGVEADVSAVTGDGRLYVVEVTTQDDSNHINEGVLRKARHFEGRGIPFRRMVYVTASRHDMHFDAGRARVLQMRHVPDLARWVGEVIDGDRAPAA